MAVEHYCLHLQLYKIHPLYLRQLQQKISVFFNILNNYFFKHTLCPVKATGSMASAAGMKIQCSFFNICTIISYGWRMGRSCIGFVCVYFFKKQTKKQHVTPYVRPPKPKAQTPAWLCQ